MYSDGMKETKVEGEVRGKRYIIRRVFIDSGKVARILIDAKAVTNDAAKMQLRGAIEFHKKGS